MRKGSETIHSQSFNPKDNHILTIIMGALLLGFAWQIRGSGTSDPSVVALLFLLFLSINYSPRKKFNILIFGLIAFTFNLMRTGWGTFVAQAGLPGIDLDQVAVIRNMDFIIPVNWYMGYFWMFIVGISWFGIPSLLFGGYFFTKLKYTYKDVLIIVVLFIATRFLAGFLADFLIPYLAPEYYKDIYLAGVATRNYESMHGNMSTAMAIIPVLLYIRYIKVDKKFFKYALSAMLIFAFSLAVADVWWPLGRLLGMGGGTAWSQWEYFTGFFFGGLIFWFYGRFSDDELAETDRPTGQKYLNWNPVGKFVLFAVAFYFFFLHGVAESLDVATRLCFEALGIGLSYELTNFLIIGLGGTVLYWFYYNGKIGQAFAQKSFLEKSLIALVILLPFYYLNFTVRHVIKGDLFLIDKDNSAVWLDTMSFCLVEIYVIFLLWRYRKSPIVKKQY